MSITLKAKDLAGVLGALNALDGKVRLGTQLNFKIARIRREVTPELKTFEEQRELIVNEHGVKVGKGEREFTRLVPGSEGYAEGKAKLDELLEQDLTLPGVDPLPAALFLEKLASLDEESDEDEEEKPILPLGQILEGLFPVLDNDTEEALNGSGNRSARRKKQRGT